jgi:PAS domain S-box-containing protein
MNGIKLKYVTPAVVALAGLLGSVALFLWSSALEQEQAQVRFQRAASDRVLAVQSGIGRSADAIESLEAFYRASEQVGRDEFRTFVQPFFSQGLGLQALEWLPRIPDAERRSYSQRAANELGLDFSITEMDPGRRPVTATRRSEYFPVYFVEPYEGNEAALGFDLSSSEVRAAALWKARDTGRMVATERITLIQETGEQYGYLLIFPVYGRGMSTRTVADRRTSLRGFVLGVFRIGEQVDALLSRLRPGGVNIYVFDDFAPPESSLLVFHESRLAGNGDGEDPSTRQELELGLHFVASISVGDRTWQIYGEPFGKAYDARIWLSWTAAGGLLAFSLLLAFYLVHLRARSARVEELVEQRTGQLKRTEARIRAIVETAVEAIITIEPEGIIESVNPATERLFGYSKEALVGTNISLLMPSPHREQHDEYLVNYLETGVRKVIGRTRELTAQRKDGTTFPMELAVSEWFAGTQRMYTGIMRDITDRKVAEDRILETAKMKSHLVSVVSHELRTPLTAIAEGVNLVLEGKAGETLPEQRECLSVSKRNIDRLSRLINDVLDYQKLETGGLPLRIQSSDLNNLVCEARKSFSREAQAAGFELELVLDENLEALECDPDYILQVLANLVHNAIKFTSGGTIRLITEQLASTARVSVQDEGEGIAPEDLSQLFKPFSQVSRDDGRIHKGTGLGLAICRLLIEKHGGSIDVRSSVGTGTSFFFTLPSKVVDVND